MHGQREEHFKVLAEVWTKHPPYKLQLKETPNSRLGNFLPDDIKTYRIIITAKVLEGEEEECTINRKMQ